MNTTYCYSTGQRSEVESRETADVSELIKHLHELMQSKRLLMTKPPGVDGYLDFYARDDGSIEMEIMDHCNDDFATVDIAMAERVIGIAMTDTRDLLLRQKLDGLKIDWIT